MAVPNKRTTPIRDAVIDEAGELPVSNTSQPLYASLDLAAQQALKSVFELADDSSIDNKLKFEIYKWICEMHFGKPTNSSKADHGEQSLILSFEGELDKWSK